LPFAAKGEFALVTQTLEAALDKPGQPVRRGTMAHDHHIYMLLADAAAERRDAVALDRYVPRLRELAERDQHQLYLGVARRAEGVARRLSGDLDEAQGCFQQAADVFAKLETNWQLGRTHVEMAEMEQSQANPAAAEQHLKLALSAFEALGAAPDAARAREALKALA
jgi:tetratricopeptide (TPR) repeat protein